MVGLLLREGPIASSRVSFCEDVDAATDEGAFGEVDEDAIDSSFKGPSFKPQDERERERERVCYYVVTSN